MISFISVFYPPTFLPSYKSEIDALMTAILIFGYNQFLNILHRNLISMNFDKKRKVRLFSWYFYHTRTLGITADTRVNKQCKWPQIIRRNRSGLYTCVHLPTRGRLPSHQNSCDCCKSSFQSNPLRNILLPFESMQYGTLQIV